MPGRDLFQDNVQQMAQSLQNIEQFLAMQNGMGGGGTKNVFAGQGPAAQSGVLDPGAYVVKETDDLDTVDAGGSVTLEPGDTKTLVEARAATDTGLALLAVGANDQPNVQYRLRVDDDRVIGGTTNSPLGVLNDPHSFIEEFGAVVPVEQYVEYEATYDANASGTVDLAGRLHVEML